MKLIRWERLSSEDTLARFKQTRLKGFDHPQIYADARLSLWRQAPTDALVPTQRYVLKADLDSVLTLADLFAAEGVDIFDLDGALLFWLERDDGEVEGPIPLTPPMIEESVEPDGSVVRLINDGMHRVAAARSRGRPITVVLAENVPTAYPYYAFPMADGWATLQVLDDLPDGFQKKAYRVPDHYKSLFRDFNAVFPGVQKQRKQSNPAHLRA